MAVEQIITILAGMLVTYLFEMFISIPLDGDEALMENVMAYREQFDRDEFHTLEAFTPADKPGASPLITTWDCQFNPA